MVVHAPAPIMRILALFLIVALAGCLGGDEAPAENDGGPDDGRDDGLEIGGNETAHGNVDSSYDVTFLNGSFEPNVTSGYSPLSVTFVIDANYVLNGTEQFAEGRDEKDVSELNGSFAWTFDQNSDGNPEAEGIEVPFNLTVLFSQPGSFNATIMMAGQNLTFESTVTISTETFVPLIPPTIYEGIVAEVCPQCTAEQGGYDFSLSHLTDINGLDGTWGEIPADLAGAPFVATTTAGNVGVSFQATCNGDEVEALTPGKTVVGTVPSGAGCVWMWEDSNARGSKLSFIANGDLTMLPDDGMCWAPDGILVGQASGTGMYVTDGTWFYAETNGVPGLQWSEEATPGLAEVHKAGCLNGDQIII
jgi:hypothetical protein